MRATDSGENKFCQWLFLSCPVLFQLSKFLLRFYTLGTSMSSLATPFSTSQFNLSNAYAIIKLLAVSGNWYGKEYDAPGWFTIR